MIRRHSQLLAVAAVLMAGLLLVMTVPARPARGAADPRMAAAAGRYRAVAAWGGSELLAQLKTLAPAPAADPFQFREVQLNMDGRPPMALPDGTTDAEVGRAVNEVHFVFNGDLDTAQDLSGLITLTDSTGAPGPWTSPTINQTVIDMRSSVPLKANEHYTLVVKGGPDGVRSAGGERLAADVHISFHTGDEAVRQTVTVHTNWGRFQVEQSDLYALTARAGDLQLAMRSTGDQWVGVELVDEQANQSLLRSDWLVSGGRIEHVQLPHDGSYSLYVFYNRLDSVDITANDLQLSASTPAVTLPAMRRYETHNERFTFAGGLRNPTETERVALFLDDGLVAGDLFQPDGSLRPVDVETAPLAEGIHTLVLVGDATQSDNLGFAGIPFLVDRVDSFPDVPADHWAHRYVEVMHHLGIVNGRDTGVFDPSASVTRAEFAKLLALTLGLQASPGTANPFVDIDGHWATPYILALWEHGLITGDVQEGQRYFYPNRSISRAEAATILGRALGVADRPYTGEPFADWAEVPEWARSSVAALAEMGWINGFPDRTYHPFRPLQRDQSAKILAGFYGV